MSKTQKSANGGKLPQMIKALQDADRFGPEHELWNAKIDWGSSGGASWGDDSNRPSDKLGGYNDRFAFYVESDPTGAGQPRLVIAPVVRNGNARSFNWEEGHRREMTPADLGALTTVLAMSIEEMQRPKVDSAGKQKMLDKIVQLRTIQEGLPHMAADRIESAIHSLEQIVSNRPSPLQTHAEAVLASVSNPHNWATQPIHRSGAGEGTSVFARRMKGEI